MLASWAMLQGEKGWKIDWQGKHLRSHNLGDKFASHTHIILQGGCFTIKVNHQNCLPLQKKSIICKCVPSFIEQKLYICWSTFYAAIKVSQYSSALCKNLHLTLWKMLCFMTGLKHITEFDEIY